MDYLVIGSNGFAQVGTPEYLEKNHVEMRALLEHLTNNFPIPDELSNMCFYKVKWFQHDFGSYSEIVLVYNNNVLEDWEDEEPERFDRFWDWFNSVESVNLESEELTQCIKERYLESIKLKDTG